MDIRSLFHGAADILSFVHRWQPTTPDPMYNELIIILGPIILVTHRDVLWANSIKELQADGDANIGNITK